MTRCIDRRYGVIDGKVPFSRGVMAAHDEEQQTGGDMVVCIQENFYARHMQGFSTISEEVNMVYRGEFHRVHECSKAV